MAAVLELVQRLAPTQVPVLIRGESGTGKELVARALHQQGLRSRAAVPGGQLGGAARSAARIGAVRLQEGGVHRRGSRPGGHLRRGPGRHGVPRRDRAHAAVVSGEAAAGAAGAHRDAARLGRGAAAWRSGWSWPPTAACASALPKARSARTSITASAWPPSTSRRCGSGPRTSCRWRCTSWPRTRARCGSAARRRCRPAARAALRAPSLAGQRARARERHAAGAGALPRRRHRRRSPEPRRRGGTPSTATFRRTSPTRRASRRCSRPTSGG